MTPPAAAIRPGEAIALEAEARYRDGSARDVTALADWTAAGSAAVDRGGLATGQAPGPAVVAAAFGGLEAAAGLRVELEAPALRALEIEPARAELVPGGAVALAAIGRYADGSRRDLTRLVGWSAPDPAPGAFAAGGRPGTWVATGAGRARLGAALGALRAQAEVRVAAPRPPGAFPVRVSQDGRHLAGRDGAPFRIQGEAAWSLIANLTDAEAEAYLDDRRTRGFNSLLVNLLEHRYAADPPRNRAGVAPFRVAGSLGEPVEAYFDHAVAVVERARARGFLVFLVPAYPGFGCPRDPAPANDGWSAEMWATPPAACRAYGRYAGRRFSHLDDLIWVDGGDCTPPAGSALEACALEVMRGIRDEAPAALHTGHWRPHSTSLDQAAFAPAMGLDAVYRYRTPHAACRVAWEQTPVLPTFLVETGYEGEAIDGSSPPTRQYQYGAAAACTAGQFFGSRPVWLFGPGWREGLASPGSQDMARLGRLLDALPWNELLPSGLAGMRTLVTAGGGSPGGQDEVAAAATADGRALLAYLPPAGGGPRHLVVDLGALPGPATARWYDPQGGGWLPLGRTAGGRRWFTTPGRRPGELDDWVLVVTRPAAAGLAPGGEKG